MRFDLTISIGNIITILSVAGVALGAIYRVNRLLNWFLVEHEILIKDYADRHNLEVNELPTRIRQKLGI